MTNDANVATRPWWQRPWVLGAVLLVAIAIYLTQCRSAPKTAAYDTAIVTRGDIISRVSASGSLSATVTVEVGSQVSGRVQSLNADFNSMVRKGQLIAKIDPALYDAAVAQARANVAAALGNVARLSAQSADAKRQSLRSVQLFDQKIISENDRDVAVLNARAAAAALQQGEGQLAQARAALQQAMTNLRYTDILSPTDGIVISRSVNVGQTVAASLAAPVLFTIAEDLRAMELHTNIAESDIGRLKAGMDATFTVDAWPGERFRGRIREVRNSPQVVQNVVTYDAVIDVANAELKLKPGMTATVTVMIDERHDALRIPNAALRYRPVAPANDSRANAQDANAHTRGRAVWLLVEGKPQRRTLQTGISDGTVTEVAAGDVKAGDQVIVAAQGTGGAAGGPPGMGGGRGLRIL